MVVPLNVDPSKFGSKPIGGDIKRLLEGMEQMVGMMAPYVLYAKVIHNKYKDDGLPFVAPEAGCDVTLRVAMLGQALSEEVIGKLTSLFQSVDSFGDLKVHPIIEHELHEVIFIDELLGDLGDVDSDVFRAIKGSAQVKVG